HILVIGGSGEWGVSEPWFWTRVVRGNVGDSSVRDGAATGRQMHPTNTAKNGTPPQPGFYGRTNFESGPSQGQAPRSSQTFEPNRGGGDDDLQIFGRRGVGAGDDPGAGAELSHLRCARFPIWRAADFPDHGWLDLVPAAGGGGSANPTTAA